MNYFGKLFLVALVALSGSLFAGCRSCRGKRSGKAARVTLVRKMQTRKVSGRSSARKMSKGNSGRKMHRSRAALATFIHKKKGGKCKNGVCSLS